MSTERPGTELKVRTIPQKVIHIPEGGFQVGDVVFDVRYGKGKVIGAGESRACPVRVEYPGSIQGYSEKGYHARGDTCPTLSLLHRHGKRVVTHYAIWKNDLQNGHPEISCGCNTAQDAKSMICVGPFTYDGDYESVTTTRAWTAPGFDPGESEGEK